MEDFTIQKYKTRNVITLYKNDYRTLRVAIAKGYGLTCLNKTFVRLNAKDKKRFAKITVKEYSKGKPFTFFNITFKPKINFNRHSFISTKNFLNENIIFCKGHLIVGEKQTLLDLFNELSEGFQFMELHPHTDKQIEKFNTLV